MTTTAPAGFIQQPADAFMGGDIHRGPAAGDVETTWTPAEGFLVHVGDAEGITLAEAAQLAEDLRRVLEGVASL